THKVCKHDRRRERIERSRRRQPRVAASRAQCPRRRVRAYKKGGVSWGAGAFGGGGVGTRSRGSRTPPPSPLRGGSRAAAGRSLGAVGRGAGEELAHATERAQQRGRFRRQEDLRRLAVGDDLEGL